MTDWVNSTLLNILTYCCADKQKENATQDAGILKQTSLVINLSFPFIKSFHQCREAQQQRTGCPEEHENRKQHSTEGQQQYLNINTITSTLHAIDIFPAQWWFV